MTAIENILARYRGLLYKSTGSNGLSRVQLEKEAEEKAKQEIKDLMFELTRKVPGMNHGVDAMLAIMIKRIEDL